MLPSANNKYEYSFGYTTSTVANSSQMQIKSRIPYALLHAEWERMMQRNNVVSVRPINEEAGGCKVTKHWGWGPTVHQTHIPKSNRKRPVEDMYVVYDTVLSLHKRPRKTWKNNATWYPSDQE